MLGRRGSRCCCGPDDTCNCSTATVVVSGGTNPTGFSCAGTLNYASLFNATHVFDPCEDTNTLSATGGIYAPRVFASACSCLLNSGFNNGTIQHAISRTGGTTTSTVTIVTSSQVNGVVCTETWVFSGSTTTACDSLSSLSLSLTSTPTACTAAGPYCSSQYWVDFTSATVSVSTT